MSKSIDDVAAERGRQIALEGRSSKHDDAMQPGELAVAGLCYAGHAAATLAGCGQDTIPSPWPWHQRFWKPKGPRRDLVRAAALLIAEIDRIDRLEGNP